MDTAQIGCIDLNIRGLELELASINKLELKSVYEEFICGSWLTLALWNKTGKNDDLIIKSYQESAKPTDLAKNLPGLISILDKYFNLEFIKYGRVALLAPSSVILPHRDYLETKEEFLRFHIPLITDEQCFYAEEDSIFRLAKGEIWFIDAKKPHSVGCFSEKSRLHLILDFPVMKNFDQFIKNNALFSTFKNFKPINRKPLSNEQYQAILGLSELITMNNFMDIASILTKQIYQVDCYVTEVFSWLKAIAQQNKDQAIIMKLDQLHKHCIKIR